MDAADSTYNPSSSRKRSRDNETDAQRTKREKAAERQRRKRERDRIGGALDSPSGPSNMPHSPLSAEEEARKDRIRAAARERQRKHRRLVKQRKMHELGLDMGNEVLPGFDEAHFRVGSDGNYQQVLPPSSASPSGPDIHQQIAATAQALTANIQSSAVGEPPFVAGGPSGGPPLQNGGQTFASTLLLSFSCAPLLKQHLLRNLDMTNEELASLEPIIADAWDHWNQQRRIHYEQAAAAASGSSVESQQSAPFGVPPPNALPTPPNGAQQEPNEFRARFQNQLTAPSPFHGVAPTVVQQPPVVQSHNQPHLDPALTSNPPTRPASATKAPSDAINSTGEWDTYPGGQNSK